MKAPDAGFMMLILTCLGAWRPVPARAAEWTPLRLTLWPERLELFGAPVVRGLSLGPLAARSDDSYGLQASGVYSMSKAVVGAQVGAIAIADSVQGLQLGLADLADSVSGLQVGVLTGAGSEESDGRLAGLQVGGINLVEGELTGLQLGFFWNGVGGRAAKIRKGGQIGFANGGPLEGFGYEKSSSGSGSWYAVSSSMPELDAAFQLGALNRAGRVRLGAQIGLFNYCRELRGVQIGLINIASKGGLLPFTLVFNLGR